MTGLLMIGSFEKSFCGFLAAATTFSVTPFVLMVLRAGVLSATVVALKTSKRPC